MTQRTLTGITTTGTPHLGNYAGAIQPAIEACNNSNNTAFYFLADLHALIKCRDAQQIYQSTREITATWLACGVDPHKIVFYRQSDIPEISELCWILSCLTAKGLMNRSHAYKALIQENQVTDNSDPDKGITMGLFCYPILMAADILLFNAHKVPVGTDQIQHIEMARDIAMRFNHHYGQHFTLPEAINNLPTLNGLDGRKMSKSYHNTIPLFAPEKTLRQLIMKIKTNSLAPGESKVAENCTLFQIFSIFANPQEITAKKQQYAKGAGWGVIKQELFEFLNDKLRDKRKKFHDFMEDTTYMDTVLQDGASKARNIAKPFMESIKQAVGIYNLKT